MRVQRIVITSLVIFCLFLCLRPHCRNNKIYTEGNLRVVVTILPLAEFVEQIGGEHVQVIVMVPPGATPHTHEPTPTQIEQLSTADLYVKVGTPIEFEVTWLDRLLAMNKTMKVCDASHNIELLSNSHLHDTRHDPHIWLSVRNVQRMIENIAEAMALADPEHGDVFKMNMIQYHTRLDSLDKALTLMFKEKTERRFITYHAAWTYLAHDYDFKQIIIEINNKEPTAKVLENIVEIAQRNNIRVVFASPQFNTKFAKTIAHEIGGSVILVDPLDKEYVKNMGNVAQIFEKYME